MKKKLWIFVIVVMAVALAYNLGFRAGQKQGVSRIGVVGLSAASAFSPGIVLLSIAYHVKEEMNAKGEHDWFLRWLWLFWIICAVDVTLDMIPVAATVNRIFEYVLIWFVAWVGATILNSGVSLLIGGLAGSGTQLVRQAYSVGTDHATAGAGAPLRSVSEDVLAYILSKLIL